MNHFILWRNWLFSMSRYEQCRKSSLTVRKINNESIDVRCSKRQRTFAVCRRIPVEMSYGSREPLALTANCHTLTSSGFSASRRFMSSIEWQSVNPRSCPFSNLILCLGRKRNHLSFKIHSSCRRIQPVWRRSRSGKMANLHRQALLGQMTQMGRPPRSVHDWR